MSPFPPFSESSIKTVLNPPKIEIFSVKETRFRIKEADIGVCLSSIEPVETPHDSMCNGDFSKSGALMLAWLAVTVAAQTVRFLAPQARCCSA
jgi:hypothetical protein